MMSLGTARTFTPTALLVLVGATWAISVRRMTGMEMGSGPGSLPFFVVTWTAMMAAMMLPSALPVALGLDGVATFIFAVSYVAVWSIAGVGVFAAFGGIHAAAAGALFAAAVYELTPLKRRCLARCRNGVRSDESGVTAGARYGVHCLGSSAGLMLALIALGAMSVTWMLVVASLVFVEKVPRFGASLVEPVALLLVGLGAMTLTM
jgi:predicted metal-binding membrane protein